MRRYCVYLSVRSLILAFLGFTLSSQVYAVSLPPLLDWPSGQKHFFVSVPGVNKKMELIVQEVDYPDAHRKVLRSTPGELTARLDVSHGGIIFSWSGKKNSNERYFEVSLTSLSSKRYQERVTMLMVIPPHPFSLKYHFLGSVFTNKSTGYVVLMENTECGKSIGRSWLVGPRRQLSIPKLQPQSELLVGRGQHIEKLKECERL